jgi:hypothetical protein
MVWTTMDNNGQIWTNKGLRLGFSLNFDMLFLLTLHLLLWS